MRSMDPNSTKVYRWLYTFINTKGSEYYRAVGPWTRKQNVDHGREAHGAIRAELQQLEVIWSELRWVTIKTVELKNADS